LAFVMLSKSATLVHVLCIGPKTIDLAFNRWISEAGFGELIVLDFQFKELPSCDLLLTFCIMR
jgi:hypothetical protein